MPREFAFAPCLFVYRFRGLRKCTLIIRMGEPMLSHKLLFPVNVVWQLSHISSGNFAINELLFSQ